MRFVRLVISLFMVSTALLAAPVKVTINPTTATLGTGATKQFTATVTNTSNTAVTWTATGGSVSNTGFYTAGATTGTFSVSATSIADTTKKATATVTVTAPVITVTVSPSTAALNTGGTQQFTATVANTANTAVTWTATGGTITSGGLYTAPGTAGNHTVTATSAADSTKKGTATVTVTAPVAFPSLTISPASAVVNMFGTATFTATVSGLSNKNVGWRRPSKGTITQAGVYTAPNFYNQCFTGETIWTDTLEAYCIGDPSVFARVNVSYQIPPAGPVAISINQPAKVDFVEGETTTFSATVTGSTDGRVEWEDSTGMCGDRGSNTNGVIDVLGRFNAIAQSPGANWLNLRVISVADRTRWAYLLVRVWSRGTVVLNPGKLYLDGTSTPIQRVAAGGQLQLAAEVKGGGSIVWSNPSGIGSISTNGLFSAPAAPLPANRQATIRATNAADPTKYAEITIPLIEDGDVLLTGTPGYVLPGGKLTFSATTQGTNDGVNWTVVPNVAGQAAGTITSRGAYTAPSSLNSGEKVRMVIVKATNKNNAAKFAEGAIWIKVLPSPGNLSVASQSWPDTYRTASYDATGSVQGDWGTDPAAFWSISGNGTILETWFDWSHGYPCVSFRTGAVGTMTLTAHPANEVGGITVSKTVDIIAVPELSGVYADATSVQSVLDFGVKIVMRPDGQTASMRRLWHKSGVINGGVVVTEGSWVGRKLLGPGISQIYTSHSSWGAGESDDPIFSVDGLALGYSGRVRTTQVVIGAEPAGPVVDGSGRLGPSIAYMRTGQSLQLQAAVGGTTNKAVTWNCPSGSGTITSNGLYTAPATPGTYTVTVTSQADATKSYALKIRVGALDSVPAAGVTGTFTGPVVPPGNGTVVTGKADLFAEGTSVYAKISSPNKPEIRSWGPIIGCTLAGSNAVRTVFDPQPDGSYLPTVEFTGSYYLSSVYGWQTGQLALEAASRTSAVSVEIVPNDPAILKVNEGNPITLKALTLGSADTAVTWSAYPYDAYLSVTGNSVTVTGPPVTGQTQSSLNMSLRATSVADPTKQATVQITVLRNAGPWMSPSTATAGMAYGTFQGYPVQFSAYFPSQPSHDAYWSIVDGTGNGTISATGYFRPGTNVGTYTIRAVSQWDASQFVEGRVTVHETSPSIVGFAYSPSSLKAGGRVLLTWTRVDKYTDAPLTLTVRATDRVTGTTTTTEVTGLTSFEHFPTHSTDYVLQALTGSGGSSQATGSVTVGPLSGFAAVWSPNPPRVLDACALTLWFDAPQGTLAYGVKNFFGAVAWYDIAVVTPGVTLQIPANHPMWDIGPYGWPRNDFRLVATDAYGNTDQVLFTPMAMPKVVSLTAIPPGFLTGQSGNTTLNWSLNSYGRSATVTLSSVTAGGVTASYNMGGTTTKTVAISETTTFTLRIQTDWGFDEKVLVVRVADVTSITISPATTSMSPGESKIFAAAITAVPGSEGISWTRTGGTLASNGATATWTAPDLPGTYTITASSTLDPTITASAVVTVSIPPVVLNITPATLTLNPGQSHTFGSTIQVSGNPNTAVTWTTTNGSITAVGASGMYTAPWTTGLSTVTVRSVANTSVSATATITIVPPDVQVSITPSMVSLPQGETFEFGYSSSNGPVTWSANGGNVSPTGTYTAPNEVGSYTVTVASSLNPVKTATANVTVVLASTPSISVVPATASLFPSMGKTFSAAVKGLANTQVQWSVLEPDGGSVSISGIYSAPAASGIFTVVATSVSDATIKGTAKINVGSVIITPSALLLTPGEGQQFSSNVSPSTTGAVLWSVDEVGGGAIDQGGYYTPPNTQGIFHVRAQMPDGSSDVAEVKVGLVRTVTFTPTVQIDEPGDYEVQVQLSGPTGATLDAKVDFEAFMPGIYTPNIVVDGKDLAAAIGEGPYSLKTMKLVAAEDLDDVDQKVDCAQTAPYPVEAMDRPWLRIVRVVSIDGLDTNGNGLIDLLQVQVEVDTLMGGAYSLAGQVNGAGGAFVASTIPMPVQLPAGRSLVTYGFKTTGIPAANVQLPWALNLGLQTTIFPGISIWTENVGQVTGFTLSQFE